MERPQMRLFFCSLLLLLFSTCRADAAKVIGQSEPVVAVAGDDVILLCTLTNTVSTVNAVDESIEWQRPELRPKEVHFYRNRDDYNDDQNPSYRGRTSLFKEEMYTGNISLKLTRVKLSDAGIYTCFVPSLKSPDQKESDKEDSVQLIVVSRPVITIDGVDPMGVVLKCEVKGLIYIPEVTWLDSDGSILPAGPTETQTDSEGRYTVRGEVTVQKTDNNMFTCRVNQRQINHTMETQINVPDRIFPTQSWWSGWQSGWWSGSLTFGLIWVVTVLVVVVSLL